MKADSRGTSCERRAYGKALRDEVPRSSHASWDVETGRERPLELMLEQESERLAYLVGERRLRMSASPFAFFRGNALVMAADLATTPSTGLRVQACGDAHIANFGGFAASDRRLVFDVNDFDETAPGPWEWDVKRLAASIEICGRDRGFSRSWRRGAVRAAAESYRRAMALFARTGELDVWYARLDVDEVVAPALERADEARRAQVRRRLKKAYANTSERAFDRFVRWEDGEPRIAFDPPFVVPLDRFAPPSTPRGPRTGSWSCWPATASASRPRRACCSTASTSWTPRRRWWAWAAWARARGSWRVPGEADATRSSCR